MPAVRIKDHWREQRMFDRRVLVVGAVMALGIVGLIGRLILLQVVRHEYYSDLSQGNRVRTEPIPAARGLILDRYGEVVAANQPAYQLELVPEEVPDIRAALTQLVEVGLLRGEEIDELMRTIAVSRSFDSVPIRLHMSDDDVARFAVHRFEFQGIDIKTRQTRWYPNGGLAVHALGYVGAISEQDLKHIDRADYAGTALIGKLGVESTFEDQLHGKNGFREVLVNAQGRSVERQGAFVPNLRTRAPSAGEDILLSIDLKLQRVAEAALAGHRGAVIALDPNDGDVLALVSLPGFDPNLFARGITSAEYGALANDEDRPLFNRVLRGVYPPGSTVKPALALAALTYHVVDPLAHRYCAGQFHLPGSSFIYREYHNEHHGSVDLDEAVVVSCDVYFYGLAEALGIDRIAAFLAPLGFGSVTGIDVGGEKSGLLPSKEWKEKAFARPADRVWFPGETVSIGIGQGYLSVTPLQLAHYASIIAARGKIWKPRLVTGLRDPRSGAVRRLAPVPGGEVTAIAPADWERVIRDMVGVTQRGTAAGIGAHAPYIFGGKTGTAQVFTVARTEKYNARNINERLRDHSWFICFAPADSPRIALAVIEENGGAGASAAAPIARKVLDAFMLDAEGKVKSAPARPAPAAAPAAPAPIPAAPPAPAPAVTTAANHT